MTRAVPLVALAYGAYLLYTFATGALAFYIHPIYVVPAVVTGLVLVLLAGIVLAWPAGEADDHGAPPVSGLAVLAAALALGFVLPARPLSPATAAQRGVEVASLGSGDGSPTFTVTMPPEAYSIKDWVKAFQADPEPARHAGKPVRVTGFVHRTAGLAADTFLVARFVVKCCAVDARPIGLLVRRPGSSLPGDGDWVTVEGAWDVAEMGGQRRAVILAARVTPAGRPDQPYLY
jgi:uncharacterized repeat protein (TIGR03943 family)